MPQHADCQVSIVIVNYNSGSFLKEAVRSVMDQTDVTLEVIVVDNASRDDSLDALPEQIKIIRNDKNLGFAKGCNLGTAEARGQYVLFLNPDSRLHHGSLAKLVETLEQTPNAVVAGPVLLNPDGSEQAGGRRDIPSPWKTFCMLLHLDALMPDHPRFKNFNHAGRPTPENEIAVDAVSGACMLVRSSALARQGGFDEEYFLHFEDLELCMRMGRSKQLVMFVPAAKCTHTKGQCSVSRPIFVEYHKHNSFVKFMNRGFLNYYPTIFLFLVSALVYFHFFGVSVKYLFSNRKKIQISELWNRL